MADKLIDGSEFLHIPKTGGTWVRSILRKNDLLDIPCFVDKHSNYNLTKLRDFDLRTRGIRDMVNNILFKNRPIRQKALMLSEVTSKTIKRLTDKLKFHRVEPRSIYRFCFVRNPLSWYESFWKFQEENDWKTWPGDLSYPWHPNSALNGLGSNDFNEFVYNVIKKRPGYATELMYSYAKREISFIGKQENLRSDLKKVLDILGLHYNESDLSESPKKNRSKNPVSSIEWDPKLRRTVMKLEASSLAHFDYISSEEAEELGLEADVGVHDALGGRELH